jgi:hypothetical protein
MPTETKDVVEQLRFELNYLEQMALRVAAGEISAFEPFRKNPICPNFDDELNRHTCHECLLYDFVPESKQVEEVPCLHIAVTPEGESIQQLIDAGDQQRLIEATCDWLKKTIVQLESARKAGIQGSGPQAVSV